MSYFSLLNSPTPSEKELASMRVKLTDAGENQYITKKAFLKTDFWFDQYEGKPDVALEAQWAADKRAKNSESSEESSDEEENRHHKLDFARLEAVKNVLFDIHRVNNGEDKLYIPDFVDFFIEAAN